MARRSRSVTTSYAAAKSMGPMPVTSLVTAFRRAAPRPTEPRWHSAAASTLPVTPGVRRRSVGRAPGSGSVERDRVRRGHAGLVGVQVVGLRLAGQVSRYGVAVPGDLLAGTRLAPAKLRGHQRGGVRRRSQPAVADLDRRPGAAGEHVVEANRALMRARVDDLGPQVAARPLDRPAKLRPPADEAEHVVDSRAVAAEQPLDLPDPHAAGPRRFLPPRPTLSRPFLRHSRNRRRARSQ